MWLECWTSGMCNWRGICRGMFGGLQSVWRFGVLWGKTHSFIQSTPANQWLNAVYCDRSCIFKCSPIFKQLAGIQKRSYSGNVFRIFGDNSMTIPIKHIMALGLAWWPSVFLDPCLVCARIPNGHWIVSWHLHFPSGSLLVTQDGSKGWPKALGPCTFVGVLEVIPTSWLWRGSSPLCMYGFLIKIKYFFKKKRMRNQSLEWLFDLL